MSIKDRRFKWLLALTGVALLPIGMTVAVMRGLAQVRAQGEQRPRVVAAWAGGPMEVRVAFDRAVDPSVAAGLVGRTIAFADPNAPTDRATGPDGRTVAYVDPKAPADRKETGGRPGGDGGSIRVADARLDEARRTLILVTDPHPAEATYTLNLDELKGAGVAGAGRAEAVTYTLGGVEASWTPQGADRPEWSGWWPDLDPSRARAATAGSAEHDRLWPLLARAGKLALRSFVRIPDGPTVSAVTGDAAGEVTLGQESVQLEPGRAATLKGDAQNQPIEVTATLATRPGGPDVPSLRWRVGPEGKAPEQAPALSRWAFGLPWAPPELPPPPSFAIPEGLAAGGDPARGALVFAGETARCATCHQVRGQGGQVGPDLSRLAKASRAWIYGNIVEPSASIHPDYLTYTVAFKDGRVAMGTVRAEGADAIRVGDNDAKFATFPRAEVEELRPSASSIMPVGLIQALGEEKTRDLLAYLSDPANMAPVDAKPATPAPAAKP